MKILPRRFTGRPSLRGVAFLWSIVVVVSTLSAPGAYGDPPSPPSGSAPGAKELVVAYSTRDISVDPLHIYTTVESELTTALYEGLLVYHPFSLEPLPGAASRWEVSRDRRLYRFFLREDALFSDGRPVLARHFRDTWMRMIDPDNHAEYSFLFDVIKGARDYRNGNREAVVGIRAAGERILEVELEKPASHFLKLLCHSSFAVLHPFYLDKKDWGKPSSLIGNGPFFLTSRDEKEMVLEKNHFYWDAKNVGLDRIRILLVENAGEITRGFNEGRINWTNNWDNDHLKDTSKIVFNPMFATSYFYFVCSSSPWKDARVRQALTLLLPWERIRSPELIFPTHSLIPAIPSYPKVEGIQKQDRERATALLEEAGFPEGKGLPSLTIKVSEDSTNARLIEIMVETWKKALNLEIKILTFPYSAYLQEVKKDDYVLGAATWIGDYADPLTFLQMWTEGSNLNDARYAGSEFDRILDESLGETGSSRYTLLAKAEEILLQEAVILPVNHSPAFNLIDLESVEGWFPNVLNIHPFKFIHFKELRPPPGSVRAPMSTPAG